MLAVDETGSGSPLVLLHGVGSNRSVWAGVVPSLARGRHVIAPDLPGLGESPPVGRGFALDEVAAALAEELRSRTDRPFDLVGNSLGGAVALQLAHQSPHLVRSLVLVAPAVFRPAPEPLAWAADIGVGPALELRRRLGPLLLHLPGGRLALLWTTVADPSRLSRSEAAALLEASRGSTRAGAAVAAALRADLLPVLASVPVPVGLIWGRSDRTVPIGTLGVLKLARRDAAVAVIPGAGHVPQVERPDAFVAALRGLLTRLKRKRGRNNSVRGGRYVDLQGH